MATIAVETTTPACSTDTIACTDRVERETQKLLDQVQHKHSPEEKWKVLHQSLLTPEVPFEIHRACYDKVYRTTSTTPNPLWFPTSSTLSSTHTAQLQKQLGLSTYQELYDYSIAQRDAFWMHAQERIGVQWSSNHRPTQAFADTTATYFPGGQLNIADSCLKEQDNVNKPAIVFGNDTDPTAVQSWSSQQLKELVHRVAYQLQKLQYGPGTRIGVCLPLTPEAIAVYLGILQAGCVVVSIADSFSSAEIATRCRIARVSLLFTQDVLLRPNKAVPLYDRVMGALDMMTTNDEEESIDGSKIPVIVLPAALHSGSYDDASTAAATLHESIRLRLIDQSWDDFLIGSVPEFTSVIVDSMTPCNILFSSGTTGAPKAIVWSHTTPIKCAVDGHFHQNLGPDDVICWPTSLGWMMGSWLIAQRMLGTTIALYQGLPHSPQFAKFVEASQVTMLGVIPSLVQTWYDRQTTALADWSKITRFSSTGEASDPRIYHWLMSRVPGYAPVMEYCGGTEIGGSFLSSVMDLPNVPSHFNTPVLGSELRLLQEGTTHVLETSRYGSFGSDDEDVRGELVLLPPSIGFSTTLLNRDHDECYYKGMPLYKGVTLRRHGDAFLLCQGQYFRALGRCDDAMNLGGIKVSAVELERACNTVAQETAAIAIGQPSQLVVYAVTNNDDPLQLKSAMQKAIKQHLNPLFQIRHVVVVDKLPRTASNKVMRRLLRDDYLQRMESALCQ